MHDDPTRAMRQPDPGHRPHGNTRLLVAGLIAVIVGLVIAIVVIASDGDNGDSTVTTLSTTAETTTTEPTTTEPTTTETTEPTTTETTETTTAPPTVPPEEESGSGGIPAE
jgi:cytoskeletal protein RodZ